MKSSLNRRSAIKSILSGTTAVAATGVLSSFQSSMKQKDYNLKGNINHSVCRWCFHDMPLEQLCADAKAIGLKAIDLVGPQDWPTLKKYGLYSSMCNGAEINIPIGWNDIENHDTLIGNYMDMIPQVAAAGYKNLICFSGNRKGKDNETGLANCVAGLKQILPAAEKHGVVIVMELLNSKIEHKDYQCDRMEWGAALVKRLGSENFKLLFDIYHMQINEGDIIRTIQANHQYICHYHVAGVPGRHEPDDTQELYYPAIIKAIKDTGFTGYIAQEYIAKDQGKKIASLKEAIRICDV
jgi:hydroxypyruvate isomerase